MQIFQGSVLYEPEHILKFSKIFCDFPKDPNLMK